MAANAQGLIFLDTLVAIQNNDPIEAIMPAFRTRTPAEQLRLTETAVAWDRLEVVQAMLDIRPEFADRTNLDYDDTLLITAIVQEFSDMAVYLVSKTSPDTLLHVVPIHPDDPVTIDGASALHLAVARRMPDVVRAIVQKNENTVLVPNEPDGVTPIDLAKDIVDEGVKQEILGILTAKEKGRGLRNAALVGLYQNLAHPLEAQIASYATDLDKFVHQQQAQLRRKIGIEGPERRRRDIGGRKRKTRRRRTTSSRRRRTLSRARLASS